MGKLKYLTVVAAIIILSNTASAWKVVIDPYCLKAVTTNLATQKAIEDQHNKRLDSISSKQNKLEQYTVSMATITELYKVTMENISGFGTESRYYVEIGLCAFDIVKSVPGLVKTVGKANFANKALCLNELGNLTRQTSSISSTTARCRTRSKDRPQQKQNQTAITSSTGMTG